MRFEQTASRHNECLEVEWVRKFRQDAVEHLGLVWRRLEELLAPAAHDGREHVDGEDGLASKQYVKKSCDLTQRRDVVCVHGEGAGQREERLGVR